VNHPDEDFSPDDSSTAQEYWEEAAVKLVVAINPKYRADQPARASVRFFPSRLDRT
jgi:hypothetical protein